jgi:hypothetical protein
MKQNLLGVMGLCVAAAFMSGARAEGIDSLLMRNARQQSEIQQGLGSAQLDAVRAAQVQERAAEAYRDQAQMLANANDEQREQMRQTQRDIAGAIAWAEKNRAHNPGSELDRIRLQTASLRNAEQQRLLARGLETGRLSNEQVASLQGLQAQIVTEQAEAAAGGNFTQEEARAVAGAQNVQEYVIKQDPSLVSLWSLPAAGGEQQPKAD